MFDRFHKQAVIVLSVILCLFTLVEVNFPHLQVISTMAIFGMLGMVICFLSFPLHPALKEKTWAKAIDLVLVVLTIVCCSYIVIQSEEFFESLWFGDMSILNRAGVEVTFDRVIAVILFFIVLEVTRRAIGWIVPALASVFVVHSVYCYGTRMNDWPMLPDWLLPHQGFSFTDVASKSLQNGIFGQATEVMFKYVFLFVVFGAFLEISGAIQFIIAFAQRVFGRFRGGPALVSVVGSGLMGSLSGSAVANAVTTGTFTIPMMRNAGFPNHTAGGITAAAASGGALLPPVMGAGAYMMLELVSPTVNFVQVARAALIPAVLYYLSLLLIVYLYSLRMNAPSLSIASDSLGKDDPSKKIDPFNGLVFFSALGVLISLLIAGSTPCRAVTGSLVVILLFTSIRSKIGDVVISTSAQVTLVSAFLLGAIGYFAYVYLNTDILGTIDSNNEMESSVLGSMGNYLNLVLDASFVGIFALIGMALLHPVWRGPFQTAFTKSAKNGVALVAASACVGIIIAVVDQASLATSFSEIISGLVENSLFLALLGIMMASIVLGMGVPSVVCYLLLATMMSDLLTKLGVIPLGAHLFIFYFGMMSMVTPPVALAAYASASIAKARIMQTAFASFRFALVGFTLPYMFIYRPSLMLMNSEKWNLWIEAKANKDDVAAAQFLKEAEWAFPTIPDFATSMTAAVLGIVALAIGIAGYYRSELSIYARSLFFGAAALLLIPTIEIGGQEIGQWVNLSGLILLVVLLVVFFAKRSADSKLTAEIATTE